LHRTRARITAARAADIVASDAAPHAASVKGAIEETAATIKRRLWEGGCGRGADMTTGARKVIDTCVAAH
jgi:hypothetical protein